MPQFAALNVARALIAAMLFVAAPASWAADDEFLPPDQAFKYSVAATADTVTVTWNVTPGYYLYRKRLGFASETDGIDLGAPAWPTGETHDDEFFGEQEIYRGSQQFILPIERASEAPDRLELALKFQGCADAGLCYPPTTWRTKVDLPGRAAAAEGAGPLAGLRAMLGGGGRGQKILGTEEEFLPVDEAFRLSAAMDRPDLVTLTWVIADGYYLYRHRISAATDSPGVTLGDPRLPEGTPKSDEFFGDTQVYYGLLEVTVPVARPPGEDRVTIDVGFQGCADAGLCYPPTTRTVALDLPPAAAALTLAPENAPTQAEPVAEQDRLAALIRDGNLGLVLASFFGFGLLLAFTPCVLPMIPILSGIIAGGGDSTSRRAFMLSLAYVLGMALTYTIAGALFAAAGQQAQAVFQKPWIITLFAGLFVALALAMFGFYELQLPASLQSRLAGLSNQQKSGTLVGSALMGALSSLIVTACVAPPLVAALAVIGQSGDVLRGASALFAMSLGMGAPLLVVGTSAGKLLPKAGAWMNAVKGAFGVVFLGLAIWMLERILPGSVTLALWAVLAFVSGYCLYALGREPDGTGLVAARRGIGGLAMVYGVIMLVGAAAGGSDPLRPLGGISPAGGTASGAAVAAHGPEFRRIKSVADLERELVAAGAAGRPVMLDFYADWCVSCKEMEKYTFTDPAVRAALQQGVLLQADVTANDATDRALLERFGIFGPPTIAFFGPDGVERRNFRLVGFVPADRFERHVVEAFSRG
jgi:thiol:disulfide interchange protein DsbD